MYRSIILAACVACSCGTQKSSTQHQARPAVELPEPPVRVAVVTDPKSARVTFMSWDTEGGNRVERNLLRANAGVSVLIQRGKEWGPAAGTTTVQSSPSGGTTYRIDAGNGAVVVWTITAAPERISFALRCEGEGAAAFERVRLVFAFDVRATPVTALPSEWLDDGTLRLPAVVNAPDFGQMLLADTAHGQVSAWLEGDRDKHVADLVVEVADVARGRELTLTPVRLPPPAGLQDVAMWRQARRGWFGALEPSARWGNAKRPFSAPAGILANNVVSDPASLAIWMYADQAFFTPMVAPGISVAPLVRRSIDYWLDQRTRPSGEVIGYWEYGDFLDANAGPLIAAWDYVESTGDTTWLTRRIGKLEFIANFLVKRDIDGDGVVEATQSGNRATLKEPNRSCAWWDAINLGHKDGYTNAIIYRAFRSLADLERQLGRRDEAARYTAVGDKLKAGYRAALYNPQTGWLGMWRSADGELHDYASTVVNAMAIEYGLIEPEEGKAILARLRTKIAAVGFKRFDLGVPPTLLPIPRFDHIVDGPYAPKREDGTDNIGVYMNGGIAASQVFPFLAAHYVVGEADKGDAILRAMLQRQARGEFANGVVDKQYKGIDWTTWDGKPSGYEGYLADSFRFLQAVLLREKAFRDKLYRPLRPRR